MKRLLVTGATGYLGRHLVERLRLEGFIVIKAGRNRCDVPFDLRNPEWPDWLAIDAVIHAAWDLSVEDEAENRRVNVEGSRRLFQLAVEHGVKKMIFISSLGAYDEAPSLYGRSKLEVEQIAAEHGAITIRPGLLYGGRGGGITRFLSDTIRHLPVVPLVERGEQTLYPCHIDDLSLFIQWLVENAPERRTALFAAANERAMTCRQVVQRIASVQRKKRFYLSLPALFFDLPYKAAKRFGVHWRARKERLVNLLSQNPEPEFETIKVWPGHFRGGLS